MAKRHSMMWVAALTGWTLIGLTFTLNYYLFAGHYVAIFKEPPTLKEMLVWELPYWLLWAALSPLILRLTRRFRIERERWARSLAVHVVACLILSIAHRAVYLVIGWLLHVAAYQKLSSIPELYASDILFNLPTGFMSYAAILLVSHAIDYYHRYQEEELKISRLETELAQAQLQAARAQLEALKMQLQPHFLFNTLNSISALLEEDAQAAEEMIARLGDFLRLTLESSGAQEVPLQEEMEFLRCYLEIERVRFQDRLSVLIEIAPDALDALVPNMILQPIVENAIRHGIAERISEGRIEIRAARVGDSLRLSVKDNGPGLSSGRPTGSKLKPGLGLSNTCARLEQLYGASHSLEIADAREGGAQVTVEIPFVAARTIGIKQQAAV
ncbi:MAG TPA: histidine kinase [Blastocatellia bacterium]|nr:histidine kinase [Blastocatellia bacterium]